MRNREEARAKAQAAKEELAQAAEKVSSAADSVTEASGKNSAIAQKAEEFKGIVEDVEKTLRTFLPERVIESGPAAPEASAESSKPSPVTVDKARSLGLNVKAAIEYSCGEEDLYIELLTDYAKNAEDKCATLASYLEDNSLSNYRVLIHSLKSSSKMIGADELSSLAKDLEDASARSDEEYVKSHHDDFAKRFKDLASKILG